MPDTPGPGSSRFQTPPPTDCGQQLFQAGGVEFAENPESRCPCVLLLDTSHSMHGERIQSLNQALPILREELLKDPKAQQSVELAIITFGGTPKVVQEFVTVDKF